MSFSMFFHMSRSLIAKALTISVKWPWFKTCTWHTVCIKWPPPVFPVEPFWLFLQKCSHLSNEIRVMQHFLHSKSLYDIFSDLHEKDSKTLICNISWKLRRKNKQTKQPYLPALKNFPMLGETNNQFYMALMEENIILRQILKFEDWLTNEILNNKYSEPLYLWYIL